MAGRRVHFVMNPGLVDRIDAACPEGVSRGEFVRRAVERALGEAGHTSVGSVVPSGPSAEMAPSRAPSPAPAERPDTRAMDLLREDDPDPDFIARGRIPELPPSYRQHVPGPNVEGVRSSSQAKRDVRPVPKKGER